MRQERETHLEVKRTLQWSRWFLFRLALLFRFVFAHFSLALVSCRWLDREKIVEGTLTVYVMRVHPYDT